LLVPELAARQNRILLVAIIGLSIDTIVDFKLVASALIWDICCFATGLARIARVDTLIVIVV